MRTIDWSGFFPYLSIPVSGDTVQLPVYFIITSLACCLSILWLVRRADKQEFSRNRAIDTALVLMISGFIGARVFHVVFEEPQYYLHSPMRVFAFLQGGFVWYGGA